MDSSFKNEKDYAKVLILTEDFAHTLEDAVKQVSKLNITSFVISFHPGRIDETGAEYCTVVFRTEDYLTHTYLYKKLGRKPFTSKKYFG